MSLLLSSSSFPPFPAVHTAVHIPPQTPGIFTTTVVMETLRLAPYQPPWRLRFCYLSGAMHLCHLSQGLWSDTCVDLVSTLKSLVFFFYTEVLCKKSPERSLCTHCSLTSRCWLKSKVKAVRPPCWYSEQWLPRCTFNTFRLRVRQMMHPLAAGTDHASFRWL